MSSEILLRGRGITKVYSSPLHPIEQLKAALFRREPRGEIYRVLDSIDIDIYRGETVGIMGRNGAGKSTLLGILGNVIPANGGTVERMGKIAVLLELGAGFNPNLSGIQNIQIYCRIMGIPNDLIESKIEQIEEFAELDKYFYLPLRTYSSGMYSRLAFSAAIHVDADVVIIDETLSVGDASFKMKCYAQIEQMKRNGMTFLLVSHSQNLIANFCTRAIVIEGGRKQFDGIPLEAVGVYKEIRAQIDLQRKPKVIPLKQSNQNDKNVIEHLVPMNFTYREENQNGHKIGMLGMVLKAEKVSKYPVIALGIRNSLGISICSVSSDDFDNPLPSLEAGDSVAMEVKFKNFLSPGPYFVTCKASEHVGNVEKVVALQNNALRFDVVKPKCGYGVVDLDMELSWDV